MHDIHLECIESVLRNTETIEGPYEWQGALIYSGFDKDTITGTDVLDYVDEEYALKNYVRNNGYNFEEYPNAIDPSVFYDTDDRMWMVYGSWSGGIYLLEIDPATGQVIHPRQMKNIMWMRITEKAARRWT